MENNKSILGMEVSKLVPTPEPNPITIEPTPPAPQKRKRRLSKKYRKRIREQNKRATPISFRPTKQNSAWLHTKPNRTAIIQGLVTTQRRIEELHELKLNEIRRAFEGKGNYDFVQDDFDNTQNEN